MALLSRCHWRPFRIRGGKGLQLFIVLLTLLLVNEMYIWVCFPFSVLFYYYYPYYLSKRDMCYVCFFLFSLFSYEVEGGEKRGHGYKM